MATEKWGLGRFCPLAS